MPHVRGFALVATAAAVKVPAAVALPFLVWVWAAHRAGASRRMLVPMAGAVVTVVGVFGLWTVVAGVDLGWLSALGTNSWVETWLSIPTAAGKLLGYLTPLGTEAGVLAVARLGRARWAGCLAVVAFPRRRRGGGSRGRARPARDRAVQRGDVSLVRQLAVGWWGFAAVYLLAPLVGLVSVHDGSNRHEHSRALRRRSRR
jgi:hypothetical protein